MMATEPEREPLVVMATTRYLKEVKRVRKRGKDTARLIEVVDVLRNRRSLEVRHRDHALTGNWKGWRECHVEPDWLLFYQTTEAELILGRTGTHSDLF